MTDSLLYDATPLNTPEHAWNREALLTLEVDQLALIVFDSALPQAEAWDTGAGSPYSATAWRFFRFARQLGFNGIQFGPQGAISQSNPSPYDSTTFSRNPLSLAFDALTLPRDQGGEGLFSVDEIGVALSGRPLGASERVPHSHAYQVTKKLTTGMQRRLHAARRQVDPGFLTQHEWWLTADALYSALCTYNGVGDHSLWPDACDRLLWTGAQLTASRSTASERFVGLELAAPQAQRLRALSTRFASSIADYVATQFLLHQQHEALLSRGHQLGLEFFGDLQVGYSRRDRWHFASLFLDGYLMGAPPSRTNPEGQPWGYPVLDPALFTRSDGSRGPAINLIEARARKYFSEYNRIRIDHPHGLVCPWVYAAETGDDVRAVQNGARLFSSPHLMDHPRLGDYSLVGSDDIDSSLPRRDENWVRHLTPAQVGRFAKSFDELATQARQHGGVELLICEVLSTRPRELAEVLKHYGLGRFRITQKANIYEPSDVYRSENAQPEDWILMGNHDTPSIWQVIERWTDSGQFRDRADYYASRLSNDTEGRDALARQFRQSHTELAHAAFADLLASPARHVLVAFTDLFGFEQAYNTPGVVCGDNWALRISRDFEQDYAGRVPEGRALSVNRALRLALARRAPDSALLREGPEPRATLQTTSQGLAT